MRQARNRLPHFLFAPVLCAHIKKIRRKIKRAEFTSFKNRFEHLLPDVGAVG
jgi:hypothetical protein